jgi:starvation-inducible DNA-binding protein
MSNQEHSPCLNPTRIGIPLEIRLFLITLLNQSLACSVDLRSQVKQASWNVKGRDFAQLQALFETMASELDAYVNLMAERIVVLGGVALGTVRTAATHSTLPEFPADLAEGKAHALALADRFAHYATAIRDAITRAADVGDADTAAIYTDISRGVDKRLGGLDAHLHQ